MNILKKVRNYYVRFKGEKGIIGFSHQNEPIFYFCVKKTQRPKIIVQYSIHAREYITSYLALKQINDFVKNGKKGAVYFLPLVNPDGVKIALKDGLYKANARGVDLNVNFNARWGRGVSNVKIAGKSDFIGERYESEKETKALVDFTKKVCPDITLSYHAKGEEIYYEFFQEKRHKKRDYKIAKKLAKTTGYKIKSTIGSCGGYKDWCIDKLKIPAFTIEVAPDTFIHPIKEKHINGIYEKNKNVIKVLTQIKIKR